LSGVRNVPNHGGKASQPLNSKRQEKGKGTEKRKTVFGTQRGNIEVAPRSGQTTGRLLFKQAQKRILTES